MSLPTESQPLRSLIHQKFLFHIFRPEPHLFLRETSHGLDFSLSTNVSTFNTAPDTWIPLQSFGPMLRGGYFKDSFFVCDSIQICKQWPIGHSQWIDIPNYQELERHGMSLTPVGGKMLVAGGEAISTSE